MSNEKSVSFSENVTLLLPPLEDDACDDRKRLVSFSSETTLLGVEAEIEEERRVSFAATDVIVLDTLDVDEMDHYRNSVGEASESEVFSDKRKVSFSSEVVQHVDRRSFDDELSKPTLESSSSDSSTVFEEPMSSPNLVRWTSFSPPPTDPLSRTSSSPFTPSPSLVDSQFDVHGMIKPTSSSQNSDVHEWITFSHLQKDFTSSSDNDVYLDRKVEARSPTRVPGVKSSHSTHMIRNGRYGCLRPFQDNQGNGSPPTRDKDTESRVSFAEHVIVVLPVSTDDGGAHVTLPSPTCINAGLLHGGDPPQSDKKIQPNKMNPQICAEINLATPTSQMHSHRDKAEQVSGSTDSSSCTKHSVSFSAKVTVVLPPQDREEKRVSFDEIVMVVHRDASEPAPYPAHLDHSDKPISLDKAPNNDFRNDHNITNISFHAKESHGHTDTSTDTDNSDSFFLSETKAELLEDPPPKRVSWCPAIHTVDRIRSYTFPCSIPSIPSVSSMRSISSIPSSPSHNNAQQPSVLPHLIIPQSASSKIEIITPSNQDVDSSSTPTFESCLPTPNIDSPTSIKAVDSRMILHQSSDYDERDHSNNDRDRDHSGSDHLVNCSTADHHTNVTDEIQLPGLACKSIGVHRSLESFGSLDKSPLLRRQANGTESTDGNASTPRASSPYPGRRIKFRNRRGRGRSSSLSSSSSSFSRSRACRGRRRRKARLSSSRSSRPYRFTFPNRSRSSSPPPPDCSVTSPRIRSRRQRRRAARKKLLSQMYQSTDVQLDDEELDARSIESFMSNEDSPDKNLPSPSLSPCSFNTSGNSSPTSFKESVSIVRRVSRSVDRHPRRVRRTKRFIRARDQGNRKHRRNSWDDCTYRCRSINTSSQSFFHCIHSRSISPKSILSLSPSSSSRPFGQSRFRNLSPPPPPGNISPRLSPYPSFVSCSPPPSLGVSSEDSCEFEFGVVLPMKTLSRPVESP